MQDHISKKETSGGDQETMRVYYKCTLYEDIEDNSIPTDKAYQLAGKLDGIGIADFQIIIPEQGQQPQRQMQEQPEQEQGYQG